MVATATRITSESSRRTVAGPNMAILHHGATTSLVGLERLMEPGGRTVSAHWAVKDDDRIRKVGDDRRAWSLADAYWDSRGMTVECANESVTGWTISRESEESLAQLIADNARRFGWYPHRNGDPKTWTVIGHREVYTIHGGSYATACPGGMNLNWITGRAQELLGGAPPASVPPAAPPPAVGGYPGTWRGVDVALIQRRLVAHGFPTKVDDEYGPDTSAQVAAFQRSVGLDDDGDVGKLTWPKLLATPRKAVKPRRPVIRRGSKNAHVGLLQRTLKTRYPLYAGKLAVDNDFGPATERAVRELQRRAGLTVDGAVGPQTWGYLGL